MKQSFFKSAYFKAAIVLILLLVICGGLLAILSDVLFVSADERTMRIIKNIYGEEIGYENASDKIADFDEYDTAKFNELYLLEDGNSLVSVTGNGGYKNGTVTLWVVVEYENGSPIGLKKVAVKENEGQTLMSSFGKNFFDKYTTITVEDIKDGKIFVVKEDGENIQNVSSGASKSSTAMNNAVNAVLTEFFKGVN